MLAPIVRVVKIIESEMGIVTIQGAVREITMVEGELSH